MNRALIPLIFAACTPSMRVKDMATDDLGCPKDEIAVEGAGTYTATGCGKRMHYLYSQSGQGTGGCIRQGEVERISR